MQWSLYTNKCFHVFVSMWNWFLFHSVGQRGESPFRTHKLAHYYCLQEQISSALIKFTFRKIWEFICEYFACFVPKSHKFSFLTESTEPPTCSVDKMPLLDCQSCQCKKITCVYFYCCWSKTTFLIWWVLVFAPLPVMTGGVLNFAKLTPFAKLTELTGEYRREGARRSAEAWRAVLTGSWHTSDLQPHLWSPGDAPELSPNGKQNMDQSRRRSVRCEKHCPQISVGYWTSEGREPLMIWVWEKLRISGFCRTQQVRSRVGVNATCFICS